MKRQHPAITKKVPAITDQVNTIPTLLNMGDSLEVMKSYYSERIQELEIRLSRLTLLENAREITAVCHEIIRAKKALHKLTISGKYVA